MTNEKLLQKQILEEIKYFYGDNFVITEELINKLEVAVSELEMSPGYLTKIMENLLGKECPDIYQLCKNISKESGL